ncbi:MAG: hypothetical protein JST27_01150 [Bacteroidetes bacterium]|nr:hypothetical protein [Bacteroidota bacterium]
MTNSTCASYGAQFNPSISNPASVLAPNPNSNPCTANHTDCSSAINFVGGSVTIPVYTPNCFNNGGNSLSHFEDECLTPPANDLYFVMCNGVTTGPNSCKRYYTDEERRALCDIGYSVAGTFGTTTTFNGFKNYNTGNCNGGGIAGINDGLDDRVYKYVTQAGVPIRITDALANDFGANSMECVELAVGNGTVDIINSTTFTYTPSIPSVSAPEYDLVHVIRYVPINTLTGKRGNITYVYINVLAGTCTGCVSQAVGSMVSNGDFETYHDPVAPATGCAGWLDHSYNPYTAYLDCWTDYGGGLQTLYSTTCPTGSSYNPASFSYLPPTGASGSSNFVDLVYNSLSASPSCLQNKLSTPIVPGGKYKLSYSCINLTGNAEITAWASPNPAVPEFRGQNFNGVPSIFIEIDKNSISQTPSTTWQTYTVSVDYTHPINAAPTQLKYLIIGATGGRVLIDNVNLIETGPPSIPSSASALLAYYGSTSGVISTPNVIVIDNTFTVDANLTFDNCPNIICMPGSKIHVNSGYTLSLLNGTVLKADCGSTWLGIDHASSAHYIINDAEIHDMTLGVQINGNMTGFSCIDSRFIDNIIGLSFKNMPSSFSGTVEGNEFYTEKASLMPFSGSLRKQYGIFASDCALLTVGNLASGKGNDFHDLSTGVYFDITSSASISSCNIRLYNNSFTRIIGGYYGVPISNASPNNIFNDITGSAVFGKNNHASASAVLTVDYQNSSAQFVSNDKNIILTGFSANVSNTHMDMGYGIMCSHPTYRSYNIKDNNLTVMMSGFNLFGDPYSATITNNHITSMGGPLSWYGPLMFVTPMIALRMVTPTANNVIVSDNTVDLFGPAATAVFAQNAGSGLSVDKNLISLSAITSGSSTLCLRGIDLANSRQSRIRGNHIDGDATTESLPAPFAATDMVLDQSTNTQILCNYMSSTNYGMLVAGNCGTNPTTGLVSNTFDNHEHGINLTPTGSEGSLGNIGSPTFDCANSFNGTYTGTNNYRIYKWANCITVSPNSIYTNDGSITSGGNTPCVYVPIKNPGASFPASCSPTYPILPPGHNTVPDPAYAETVAAGQVLYAVNPLGSAWLDQLTLFEQLRADTDIRLERPVLDSFFQANIGSVIDQIGIINQELAGLEQDSLMDSAFYTKLQQITDLNAALPTPNPQAMNERDINTIYLKYLVGGPDTLSVEDSSAIANIAFQCVLEGGKAVFKARSLFAMYQPLISLRDIDICGLPLDTGNQGNQRMLPSGNRSTDFRLYPNPVSGMLYVEYPVGGQLEISDMTSRKVSSLTLPGKDGGKASFSLEHLPAGVFVCRYYVNGNLRELRKIIIVHE